MRTVILNPDKNGIEEAAKLLKKGGVVAIPTETVYGLAADALNKKAVKNIFRAKGRPSDNPLIIHTYSLEAAKALVKRIPDKAKKLADKFWPGPLTMIMEKSDIVPKETSAGLDSIAIRVPDCKAALELMRYSGLFLAAPSANISGKPSPTSAEHVINDMYGKVDGILKGEDCKVGIESTIISLLDDKVTLLRPGRITVEQLQEEVGTVIIDKAVEFKPDSTEKVLSPGMKYKHYSPDAKVILVKADKDKYINFVNSFKNSDEKILSLCYEEEKEHINVNKLILGKSNDYEQMSKNLFAMLRKADDLKASTVYVHSPLAKGVGLALYNRLIRAAGFEVIDLEE